MRYGLLTNGAAWLLFRAFEVGTTLADRIVWKTDIEKDDITASIRRLNTISRENIGDIEKFIKKLQILDEIWKSLLGKPEDLARGFIPVFASLIKEGYPDYTFEQSDVEDFIKERVKELVSPTPDLDSCHLTNLSGKTRIHRGGKYPVSTKDLLAKYGKLPAKLSGQYAVQGAGKTWDQASKIHPDGNFQYYQIRLNLIKLDKK